MGKRNLVLYVDDKLIELAKIKRLNLSAMFNQMLSIESGEDGKSSSTSDQLITKLNIELSKANEEIKRLEALVKKYKPKEYRKIEF